MKTNIDKNTISFFALIIMIVAMYKFHWISLITWAIGISLVSTLIDKDGVVSIMNNTRRRILLGVGVTLTCMSLIGEVTLVCVIMFSLGFNLTVWLIEKPRDKGTGS